MKILKLSPYCDPERISSSHISDDLTKAQIESGFTIVNYVPTPSRGLDKETIKKYKKIKYEEKFGGKYQIYRFSMFSEGKNPIIRALRYLLVNIIQFFKGVKAEGIDIITAGSTPPTQGLLCALVKSKLSKKRMKNVPFVYWLQDVFPDSLVNAGYTKKGSLLWKLGRRIENYTYSKADVIVVLGEDIKKNIIEKGVPEKKIAIIPNWINTDKVCPVLRDNNKLITELGLDPTKFIVTYAGNVGTAQGIDTILAAAELLSQREDIVFVLFAGGNRFNEVKCRVETMNNVFVFPLLPADRVSEVYSLGDLSIVACKPGVGRGAIPSKTLSIMATATPVLLSFDENTELWNMIVQNDCGYVVPAGDSEALANIVVDVQKNKEGMYNKGMNALKYVTANYSASVLTSMYCQLIRDTANG